MFLLHASYATTLLRTRRPRGGAIVFDDYGWKERSEDPLLRPGPAIDAALRLLVGKYELLNRGAQLAIRKVMG